MAKINNSITKAQSIKDNFNILLTYGDLHIPHEDHHLCNALLDIISDVDPDIILDGGDIIDADCLSSYPKSHAQLVGLQHDLDQSFTWLTQVNAAAPNARKIMLKDNHFWRRLERKKKGEVWLEQLRAVNGEHLLRLDELGWEAMLTFKWKDKIMFIHGDDKSGSGDCPVNRTRKLVQQNGMTMVRFHTHVTGVELHRHVDDIHFAIQLGTFEDSSKVSYMKHPEMSNRSTSLGLFYLPKHGHEFQFVPIFFRRGKAIFNGRIYG